MPKENKDRLRIFRRYHQLYKRRSTPHGGCVYCGDLAETTDHVPPLVWVDSLGTDYFTSAGIELELYPACRECNSLLSDRDLFTIQDRAVYMNRTLKKRYAKFIKSETHWTVEEIYELGPGLRSVVVQHSDISSAVRRRISHTEIYDPESAD